MGLSSGAYITIYNSCEELREADSGVVLLICTMYIRSILTVWQSDSLYISVSNTESGTVRSESWSYEEHQEEVDIEEGIRQVESLLSSVLRERSRNLQSSEGPARPLLSDIEKQIRQLERGQQTLAQVVQALRAQANTEKNKNQQAPLQFQARVEVRHRSSRDQRKTGECWDLSGESVSDGITSQAIVLPARNCFTWISLTL